MDQTQILSTICAEYKTILSDNLVGIYVHGSIAFHCFNWNKSDIDFLVVVNVSPSQNQKEAMIRTILKLIPNSPPKGLEMSVVLYNDCKNFKYPTPFELHFSNMHIEKAKKNLMEYCHKMNGLDCDLAAHFTVIRSVGIVLCGNPIEDVFEVIPKQAYLASIKSDIEDAEKEFSHNPICITLNLCRVLAYIKSDIVLSKEQGGLWGITHLPEEFVPIVQNALECYGSEKEMNIDSNVGQKFSCYMKNNLATMLNDAISNIQAEIMSLHTKI